MNKLNIWLLQTGEPLPLDTKIKKMRTALLADVLIDRAHTVLWWTSAFDHFKKEWIFKKDTEVVMKEGLKIIALKGTGYKRNISIRRFIDHRIIARKFRNLAHKMVRPDIIIASMPPHDLAYEAVKFGARNNVPVIVDIRDPWPDIFLNHVPGIFQKFAKIVFCRDFSMLKKTMQLADGLTAVTSTFLEWGLRYAKREKTLRDKVFYLGCKRNTDIHNQPNKIVRLIDNLNNKFVVTFVGTIAYYHNPSIVIDCAHKLSKNNIQFVIAGDGEFFDEIKIKTSLLKNVILSGWLDQAEINTLLEYSHIGICPTTQNIDLFPNKAFTYLSAGLPVISAFQGDLKELIEKYQIGLYYPPNDAEALANCINRLYEDKRLYKKMSENARKIFDEMFDADRIYEEYAKHIDQLTNSLVRN